MNRRTLLHRFTLLAFAPLLPACSRAANPAEAVPTVTPLSKSPEHRRKLLIPAAYQVLFEHGTERAFSSPLNKEERAGSYLCAACYLPLFDSADKFDSGTGWPSFTRSLAGHV